MQSTSSARDISSYANNDLTSLLNKYIVNPKRALDSISVKSSRSNFRGGKETANFYSLLRMEVGKEAFLRHAQQHGHDYDSVLNLIEGSGLSDYSKRETKRLANWAAFKNITSVFARAIKDKDFSTTFEIIEKTQELFSTHKAGAKSARFAEEFRKSLNYLFKEKISTSANSLANTDLALRRLTDTTGLTGLLKKFDYISYGHGFDRRRRER